MQYVHVRNLKKFQPYYTDRNHIWAKIYFELVHGDENAEMLGEVAWSRLVKFIVMETCRGKLTPIDVQYLSKRGFDFGLESLDVTLKSLSHFIEIKEVREECIQNGTKMDTECAERVDKSRVDKSRYIRSNFESLSLEDDPLRRKKQKADLPPGFLEFWSAYPKHVAKVAAVRAWKNLAPNEQLQSQILAAIECAKTSQAWAKDEGRFIPHPATYLNQRRFEDEIKEKSLTADEVLKKVFT